MIKEDEARDKTEVTSPIELHELSLEDTNIKPNEKELPNTGLKNRHDSISKDAREPLDTRDVQDKSSPQEEILKDDTSSTELSDQEKHEVAPDTLISEKLGQDDASQGTEVTETEVTVPDPSPGKEENPSRDSDQHTSSKSNEDQLRAREKASTESEAATSRTQSSCLKKTFSGSKDRFASRTGSFSFKLAAQVVEIEPQKDIVPFITEDEKEEWACDDDIDYELQEADETTTTRDAESAALGPKNFKKIQKLGTGFCGKVYLVEGKDLPHGDDGVFAMKVVCKEKMLANNRVRRVLTEKEILAIANHPFIVTLHYSFQTEQHLYFIMQYCPGGEFFTMLQRQPRKCLAEPDAAFYAAEVLLALEYLHLHGIIYRDLKPENILLDSTGHIALADFDLSVKHDNSRPNISPTKRKSLWFEPSASVSHSSKRGTSANLSPVSSPRRRRQSFCKCGGSQPYPDVDTETHLDSHTRRRSLVGTHEYLAPEIIMEEGYAGSIDWWAFGILIYEMLVGTTPFKGNTPMETLEKIIEVDDEINFPVDADISRHAKHLILSLLDKDANKRLQNPITIKSHPFFRHIDWPLIRNMTPPIVPTLKHKFDTKNFSRFPIEDDDDQDVPWDRTFSQGRMIMPSPKKPLSEALTSPVNQQAFREFDFSNKSVRNLAGC